MEIPTIEEIHDNIVAFWRPAEPVAAKSEIDFTYRLTWGFDAPVDRSLLRVVRTLEGRGSRAGWRRFTVDFQLPEGVVTPEGLSHSISTSAGKIENPVIMNNPEIGGVRLAFEVDTGGGDIAELRASLMRGDARASEVWAFRWTA